MKSSIAKRALGVIATAGILTNAEVSFAQRYTVSSVSVAPNIEYRLRLDGRHFGTIIETPAGGLAIRPHPGLDRNGWGSSLYLQPGFNGVKNAGHVSTFSTDASGANIAMNGVLYMGTTTVGTWSHTLRFQFNPDTKRITAISPSGYSITLPKSLNAIGANADMTLFSLDSNKLRNVPLLGGTTGTTGDCIGAVIMGSGYTNNLWTPDDSAFYTYPIACDYPTQMNNSLQVNLLGTRNIVDTARQGFAPIQAAYKPSFQVTIQSLLPGGDFLYGGCYTWSQSLNFAADNVTIAPVVLRSNTVTSFNYSVGLDSVAITGDAFNGGGWTQAQTSTVANAHTTGARNGVVHPLWNAYFYRGQDNAMWVHHYNGVGWQQTSVSGNANVAGGLTYNARFNVVLYRGTDNNLWVIVWNGSQWIQAPLTSQGNVTDDIVVDSDYGWVFYRSSDNKVWIAYPDATAWHAVAAGAPVTAVAGLSTDSTTHVTYYTGSDANLYAMYVSQGRWLHVPISTNANAAAGPIIADKNYLIYYRALDGTLWAAYWTGSRWTQAQIVDRLSIGTQGALYGNFLPMFLDATGELHIGMFTESQWMNVKLPMDGTHVSIASGLSALPAWSVVFGIRNDGHICAFSYLH